MSNLLAQTYQTVLEIEDGLNELKKSLLSKERLDDSTLCAEVTKFKSKTTQSFLLLEKIQKNDGINTCKEVRNNSFKSVSPYQPSPTKVCGRLLEADGSCKACLLAAKMKPCLICEKARFLSRTTGICMSCTRTSKMRHEIYDELRGEQSIDVLQKILDEIERQIKKAKEDEEGSYSYEEDDDEDDENYDDDNDNDNDDDNDDDDNDNDDDVTKTKN